MRRRKNYNHTEEAFLLSTFSEFVKCWKSSKMLCLFVESVNGMAFMNFSVFLGNPSEAHSPQSFPQRRYPFPEKSRKKKSFKKIQRDNECAAKFQAKKRKEQAAASVVTHFLQRPLLKLQKIWGLRHQQRVGFHFKPLHKQSHPLELLQSTSANFGKHHQFRRGSKRQPRIQGPTFWETWEYE